MKCERKQRAKNDYEVYGLKKWRHDDAIYGDRKACKMVVDEGVYMEQNKSSIFGLCQ